MCAFLAYLPHVCLVYFVCLGRVVYGYLACVSHVGLSRLCMLCILHALFVCILCGCV